MSFTKIPACRKLIKAVSFAQSFDFLSKATPPLAEVDFRRKRPHYAEVGMEEILLFLMQHDFLSKETPPLAESGIPVVPVNFGDLETNREEGYVRVRQTIPYLLDDLVGVKNALPPKMFTEKFPTVKFPYSVDRKKCSSSFGLELEAMVRRGLSGLYASKFVGDRGTDRLTCLSDKDLEKYLPEIHTSMDAITEYFKRKFPPNKIHKVIAEPELVHGNVAGHPDLVVYLTPKKVAIFDVKVFSFMDVSKSRMIRAQLALYIALARSQNLECERVGVIMPWARDPAVCEYEVGKWNSDHLLKFAEVCADKVRREPAHQMKWTMLLRQFNVGSHVHIADALGLAGSGRSMSTPFQIFLYGNNPSPAGEQKDKKRWALISPGAFSAYNGFVHAPYNLNLASDEGYVVSAAKMYLEDAFRYGFKGVVFHVGHHPSPEEGVEMMERNMTSILESATFDTPFLLETPCGNQNELLSNPEDFGDFVLRFPEQLMGICLDTCHVFVAGCMPMEYIHRLGEASDRVGLIHFNGSRKKQGCCADGHGHVTRIQNIPDEELIPVLEKANNWGICSVTE